MTDDELDKARAEEALRLVKMKYKNSGFVGDSALHIAARLAREGWMPVDPLLLEARAIVEAVVPPAYAKKVKTGEWDGVPIIEATLAALRRGIKIGAGT